VVLVGTWMEDRKWRKPESSRPGVGVHNPEIPRFLVLDCVVRLVEGMALSSE
jgi:hypothetical protein